ncbi:MAG: PH domain-containing protein [Caldisericia bacterium]
MEKSEYFKKKVFYPEFKKITYFILLIHIILCLIAIIFITIHLLINKPHNFYQIIIFIPICLIIIVIFLNDLKIYRTMRYEFRENGLYLICGKNSDKISYDEIIGWEKKNLSFNPLASTRIPGYSLGDCYFSNEGTVRMYATSSGKNILLIYTKGPKNGITPKDEKEFILELEKKLKENLS